jgi:hypothetical protein
MLSVENQNITGLNDVSFTTKTFSLFIFLAVQNGLVSLVLPFVPVLEYF